MHAYSAGFTLIELMIVITIISIITTFAIPSYQTYIKRARFTEVITTAHYYKTAVVLAIQQGVHLDEIEMGHNPIPPAPRKTKNLESIVISQGVITATGTGLTDHATYILQPNREGSHWKISGTCFNQGICDMS